MTDGNSGIFVNSGEEVNDAVKSGISVTAAFVLFRYCVGAIDNVSVDVVCDVAGNFDAVDDFIVVLCTVPTEL